MRVLHVYKDYPPILGGIESHLRTLAEHQARRGLDVTVLVTSRDARTTESVEGGVRIIRAARLGELLSTPLSLELMRRLPALRPDVTHLQFPYPLGELAHWLLGRSRATVLTYQSDIVRQRLSGLAYRPLVRLLLRHAHRIITTSPNYARGSRLLRPVLEKCAMVPMGIDVKRWHGVDPGRVAELRRRFPGPLILFVGRLRYYKGLRYLIEAMAAVRGTLLVVGAGGLRRRLEEQARRSPAGDRIHFLGAVGDDWLPAHYAAADVLVLPSSHRSEAFGLVLLEAMACGTPVVSTELDTGTSFANRSGETGLVVPPRDPGALARAINACLEDPQARRAMGERGRERVSAEFGAERMVDRVLEVYREALASSARWRQVRSPVAPAPVPE